VDNEFGNFDYLMGADVDQYHPDVYAELVRWANWYLETTGINGFRLDAVKHIPSSFYKKFFEEVRAKNKGKEVFAVGEYWSYEVGPLQKYMHETDGALRLFDVPLHFKLHQASKAGNGFDMRQIFDGTLVKDSPLMAVTFVDNHDSQPGQSLQSWVEDWFKPMAYALVLLREHGYPCLFYGDYFGNDGDDKGNNKLTCHRKIIDDLLDARHHHAHGKLTDYFDHQNCVGWSWSGEEEHPGSMAVVLTNGDAGTKRMHMSECCGHTYRDITGHVEEPITTDCDGWAEFSCPPGSLSVWVSKP
jgi:alpha-amylase